MQLRTRWQFFHTRRAVFALLATVQAADWSAPVEWALASRVRAARARLDMLKEGGEAEGRCEGWVKPDRKIPTPRVPEGSGGFGAHAMR